jgi:hypothetical protein
MKNILFERYFETPACGMLYIETKNDGKLNLISRPFFVKLKNIKPGE